MGVRRKETTDVNQKSVIECVTELDKCQKEKAEQVTCYVGVRQASLRKEDMGIDLWGGS